ncbi:spore germination protein [Paenibacillus cremeus]|uniref:Spore germination protein n=1 Tax=Paenibacillus cremeus TaxID=2163881 RepID=A0A559K4I7_9BACL|nr:spore germination protein [Paenibacillus cremeus]TVY07055.1 spore germination protein [Paenibacillus cremeus]
MKISGFWKKSPKLISTKPKNDSPSPHADNPFTPENIRSLFNKSADFIMERYVLGGDIQVFLMYCDGLTDTKEINRSILPQLNSLVNHSEVQDLKLQMKLIQVADTEEIVDQIYSGMLLLLFPALGLLYSLDIADIPRRQPSESNTEMSIKGPKDGFVEELTSNVALVRKRLRTSALCYEQFTIGKRSKSKVALLYIEDITNPEIVNEARNRLQRIYIDILLSSSQLEELLADKQSSLFPLLHYTTRPDFVVDSLARGRFAVIVDGAPTAIIGPANLTLLLKTPEDAYIPFYMGTFGLFFRFMGLFISLLLPGFWSALASYNLEQLPYPLLATIGLSRIGLPIPGPLEAFLMIGLFELLREAGERLPKAVGQTVAIVGGIVVGDAAIRAGLASTTLLVVACITAVASFTLVNQSLVGTVSIVRLFVLAMSSLLGMYGFILSVIGIVLYLSSLKSFGVPVLAPISPIRWSDLIPALSRKQWRNKNLRPDIMETTDQTRQGRIK